MTAGFATAPAGCTPCWFQNARRRITQNNSRQKRLAPLTFLFTGRILPRYSRKRSCCLDDRVSSRLVPTSRVVCTGSQEAERVRTKSFCTNSFSGGYPSDAYVYSRLQPE